MIYRRSNLGFIYSSVPLVFWRILSLSSIYISSSYLSSFSFTFLLHSLTFQVVIFPPGRKRRSVADVLLTVARTVQAGGGRDGWPRQRMDACGGTMQVVRDLETLMQVCLRLVFYIFFLILLLFLLIYLVHLYLALIVVFFIPLIIITSNNVKYFSPAFKSAILSTVHFPLLSSPSGAHYLLPQCCLPPGGRWACSKARQEAPRLTFCRAPPLSTPLNTFHAT